MSRKPIDLTGQRFGRLEVIQRLFETDDFLSSMWICKCDCGNEVKIRGNNLKSGASQSCGCLHRSVMKNHKTTHGLSRSSEYSIWRNMIDRCYKETNVSFKYYGLRGITVSDEWRNSFETFYKDMGERPTSTHSLERKENTKGYSKDNCKWATATEQANNRRTSTCYEYKGETKTLSQWCDILKLRYITVYSRLKYGWTFKEAVEIPIQMK